MYKDYQVLVDALEMNSSLSEEELFAHERLVGILLDEAKNYSRSYPKWSSRCLEFASGLEHTLDMQFSLLRKWLDGDAEGFVSIWRAKKIEELLELVEDDAFYDVLRKLASLKNNQTVTKVWSFMLRMRKNRLKDLQ